MNSDRCSRPVSAQPTTISASSGATILEQRRLMVAPSTRRRANSTTSEERHRASSCPGSVAMRSPQKSRMVLVSMSTDARRQCVKPQSPTITRRRGAVLAARSRSRRRLWNRSASQQPSLAREPPWWVAATSRPCGGAKRERCTQITCC